MVPDPQIASAEAGAESNQAAGGQACPATTPADVASLFDSFKEAWQTGNPVTVTAFFTADPVLLPTVSNKPRTDAANVRDFPVSAAISSQSWRTSHVGASMPA